jgi:hypothetical protein
LLLNLCYDLFMRGMALLLLLSGAVQADESLPKPPGGEHAGSFGPSVSGGLRCRLIEDGDQLELELRNDSGQLVRFLNEAPMNRETASVRIELNDSTRPIGNGWLNSLGAESLPPHARRRYRLNQWTLSEAPSERVTAALVATPSIASRGFWTGRLACGELRRASTHTR